MAYMHDSRMHLGRVSRQSAATDRETAPKHSLTARERATANSAMRDVSEPAQLCVRSAGRKFAALCNFHNERGSDKRGPVASGTLLQKRTV